jgi:hypothetical protein
VWRWAWPASSHLYTAISFQHPQPSSWSDVLSPSPLANLLWPHML